MFQEADVYRVNRSLFSSLGRIGVFLAVFAFCVSSAIATPRLSCDVLLGRVSDDLAFAFQEIQGIPLALIQGETTPGWNDFETMKRITFAVQNGKQTAQEKGKLKNLRYALGRIEQSVPDHPALLAIRETVQKSRKLDVDVYRPGEYELKREYQHLLWELNQELPSNLKIPGVRLPYDTRTATLVEDGKALIARQEKTFEDFFSDTGFKNIQQVRTALNKFSPVTKSLASLFENEDLEFAMNRPLGARWWVPRVGFQNQRVTGSSRGTLSPDMRNNAEAKLIGVDLATYKDFDDQLKPVYGYLKPIPQPGMKQSDRAQHYGEDVYIFKKDRVHDRLTWTSGDSLGYGGWGAPTPAQKPQNWRGYFVPWKYRYLIIPDILANIQDSQMGYEASQGNLPKSMFPDFPVAPATPTPPVLKTLPAGPVVPQPEFPPQPPTVKPFMSGIPPTPPEAPSLGGIESKAPLMPPLKEGQTFLEAQAEYQASESYKKYLALTQKNSYQVKNQEYLSSNAYKEYQAKFAEFQISERQRMAEYQNSEEVKKYNLARQEWQQQANQIQAAFMQSETWKQSQEKQNAYILEYQRVNAENMEVQKVFQATPEYQDYLKALALYREAMQALHRSDLFQWYQFNVRINPYFTYAGTPLEKMRAPGTNGYIELQYWGPVTLDDVETFEFRKAPPDGEFLEELQSRGIKIRDGRQDPAVEWSP